MELSSAFLTKAAELLPVDDGTQWPSAKYRKDPVAFARDVLGIELWGKQIEVLEAIRDNLKVAVSSGNKCGKTALAAVAALWFYASFPDARVWITAATARTITRAIWREIRKLHKRSQKRIPLDGVPNQHAGSGCVAPDLREIIGFTAATKEDAAGTSGANILYLVDEASGVSEDIFEAIEGNRAGGEVRMVLISNPTRTEGQFYRAFHDEAEFWKTFTISGEETPNAISGSRLIPGLASREWIDEMERLHGRDSPFFKIRVLGQFVEGDEGKILALHEIFLAEQRYRETAAAGPLVIGLDPAGQGVGGDEGVFAPRRGQRLLALHAFRALTAQAYLVHLLAFIREYAPDLQEIVTVVLDREGAVGAEVFGVLRAAAADPKNRFRVIGVRSSDKASRQPMVYDRTRDELWAGLVAWIREGGAIPEHAKLEKDLHAPSWEGTAKNRLVVTDKDELRKILGRSPDYGDAACLATWIRGDEATLTEANSAAKARRDEDRRHANPNPYEQPFDPYG